MRPDRIHRRKRGVQRALVGALAGLTIIGGSLATGVHADPAEDALAKLNELSHQAEIATENMHAAQLDLDQKLAAQAAAEQKHTADLAAADTAKQQLATFQNSVDKIAAAQYMGGRTDGLDSMLTASSPQVLIDQLAVQRVMATEMSAQMDNFEKTSVQAAQAESASARSAADAKTAAEQAAAVRADLQSKQSKLQVEIAVVKSQYERLTPAQRDTLAAIPPVPAGVALPPPPAPLPADDPAVLAAPPAGIPPGDIAPPAAVPAPGSSGGTVAVQAALTRIGSPYSWGAEGPGAFDCSGLVKWAFSQAGISLPHSSYAQAAGGQPVSTDQMQPGDVISYYSDASHVGIYIGDGMMVHASTFGKPVVVAPVNNAPIYNVRRY
ncbi:peptidoglycan hydrolase RipC [Mycolicibacterium bacteremicum]|uniref:Endopeptidase n=1 Tax=Mycolicibacterium bacteremicum TaxID=564198 RepID=A0A1W9Z1P5_MYCBA|nr:peptidoglycan hydrolase RipC [Mycolicibacterium bacteremicum]MCV7433050.1 C40 family peptidase [Mycolicibacterium bacteremicum]ORA06215.1 endopeptidase [Mycolicibacterium bacteremicum]